MADSAFQIQYRQEFIAQFEQGQSWLRTVCTTEAVIKGNQAMFLVAGSGGATAVTRGLNGNIPPRVDSLTQVPATLVEWHDKPQRTEFNIFASQGDGRRIMQWSPASGNLNVLLASGTGTNQSAANLVAGSWTGYASLALTPQQGSAAAAANIAQPITSTWTRYAFSATVPNGATQLGVLLSATPVGTAGAADYVQIMGVQLEIGAQATPFEHRDIELELAIAQRYFFNIAEPASGVVVGAGMVAGTNAEVIFIPLPVQMYKAPTVSVSAGSFKFNIAGTATAVAGFAAGSTHTPNYISVIGTTTATSGQGTLLQGGGGAGYVQASADF